MIAMRCSKDGLPLQCGSYMLTLKLLWKAPILKLILRAMSFVFFRSIGNIFSVGGGDFLLLACRGGGGSVSTKESEDPLVRRRTRTSLYFKVLKLINARTAGACRFVWGNISFKQVQKQNRRFSCLGGKMVSRHRPRLYCVESF